MSYLRTVTLLLAATFVLSLAGQVHAQKRAHEGLYMNGRLGGAVYGGDRDNNGGEEIFSPGLSSKADKASWGLGIEFGKILSRSFTLGIGYQIADYSEIANDDIEGRPSQPSAGGNGPDDFPFLHSGSSTIRHTIPLVLRWMIVPSWTLSPYIGAGGNISLASFKYLNEETESKVSFGPTLNFGVDFVVSRHNSIFLDVLHNFTFGDYNIDAAAPDIEANNYAYDMLSMYALGIRHSFKPACGPPEITSVDTPTRIAIGEAGPVTVMVDEDACEPVDISWQFGDGEAGIGLAANHMFATPGTYSVQVTATNSYGSDSATRTVEVYDPCPVDAQIIAINRSPNDPIINETITFTADVRGTAPLTYAWDFGDGSTATGARAAHMYSEPGEYMVTLRCANCGATDSRTLRVRVTEFRCSDITELNSVFFGRNSTTIDDVASGLLGENVAVLSECPDLLVRLDGYSDRGERNPMTLSQGRAGAVEQFYIDSGVSANRLMARGLGRDPLAGKGVDGQRNRRVDSIIVDSFE
jgi:outer membrane protein OmpA-like peptidoglycan-associated protein